jgi:hypothetical protein
MKKAIYIFITLASLLIVVEATSFVLYKWKYTLTKSELDSYLKEIKLECAGPSHTQELAPWFNITHKVDAQCEGTKPNGFGFLSRSFPREKSSEYFTVLILGGSVAELVYLYNSQLSNKNEPISFFEIKLNQDYVSKNKKPFRVINAALGDFRQPQQIHNLIHLAPLVDAVVSIEGYNEMWALANNLIIPAPPGNFYLLKNIDLHRNRITLQSFINNLGYLKNLYTLKVFYKYLLNLSYVEFEEDNPSYSDYNISIKKGFARDQYINYLKTMDSICFNHKIDCHVFFQPIPFRFKKLTDKEKENVGYEENIKHLKGVIEQYTSFLQVESEQTYQKLKSVSALDIFKDSLETIYKDHIHYDHESQGYELLFERMLSSMTKSGTIKAK